MEWVAKVLRWIRSVIRWTRCVLNRQVITDTDAFIKKVEIALATADKDKDGNISLREVFSLIMVMS